MERIDALADAIVRRGCGFALLAVSTVMWGLSYDAGLCLKTGAILVALHGATLVLLGFAALRRNPRLTELWVRLGRGADLPSGYPPERLLLALQSAYFRYAELSTGVALCLAAAALVVRFAKG